MKFFDQLQREINLEKTPKRIVSLVPSQTELLVDMGLKDQIVGITKFCVHPKGLTEEKQIVGGTKGVRVQRIRDVQPDIILLNKEENTKEMVAELEKEFIVHISDVHTVEDAFELIKQYGELFDKTKKAKEISVEIKKEIASFEDFIKNKSPLKVAYFIWRKPWMVVGNDTFVNYLLKRNHFKNVYDDISRYPEIELEKLRELDYVLLSSEPYPFAEKHISDLLPYVERHKIKFVDGEFFSWYGSRLAKAFTYFKQLRQNKL